MKTKNFRKKLSLNKKTITSLTYDEMTFKVAGIGLPGDGIGGSQTDSCCLGYTDCPDCTVQTCGGATCNTCAPCPTNYSACLTVCKPGGAYC